MEIIKNSNIPLFYETSSTAKSLCALGDCLEIMRDIPDGSIDAIVTDPPYGLSDHRTSDVFSCLSSWLAGQEYRPNKKGFMGRTWDSWVPGPEVWREVFRVLKPGGHVVAFAGSRTHDLMSMALRLAGFECRDAIMDLYATSDAAREFVDSLSEGQRKALATALPADIGVLWTYGSGFPKSLDVSKAIDKAAGVEFDAVPAAGVGFMNAEGAGGYNVTKNQLVRKGESTDAARQWQGWGTALKPAFEPALLFRKPLVGTVAENVLAHGTGALNIDGCRVEDGGDETSKGRFPANLIHDGSDEALGVFPGEAGGSAARFFYCAKASKTDRGTDNSHPTVKPTELMRYLVRLVTPLGGTVLDPFMGSGSTGKAAVLEGFHFLGVEQDPSYFKIATERIQSAFDTAATNPYAD